jgi:hypothetical protein
MHDSTHSETIVVLVQNIGKWLVSQIGHLVIAVGLISLVFNYAYRYVVDWSVSSPIFYLSTIVLALAVFVIARRDYIFVNKFEFRSTQFTVQTLLGVKKTYDLSDYKWVPVLRKVISFPERNADLSFYVTNARTGKNIRNYSWAGFASEEFQRVSALYGYSAETDFKQKDFGRA